MTLVAGLSLAYLVLALISTAEVWNKGSFQAKFGASKTICSSNKATQSSYKKLNIGEYFNFVKKTQYPIEENFRNAERKVNLESGNRKWDYTTKNYKHGSITDGKNIKRKSNVGSKILQIYMTEVSTATPTKIIITDEPTPTTEYTDFTSGIQSTITEKLTPITILTSSTTVPETISTKEPPTITEDFDPSVSDETIPDLLTTSKYEDSTSINDETTMEDSRSTTKLKDFSTPTDEIDTTEVSTATSSIVITDEPTPTTEYTDFTSVIHTTTTEEFTSTIFTDSTTDSDKMTTEEPSTITDYFDPSTSDGTTGYPITTVNYADSTSINDETTNEESRSTTELIDSSTLTDEISTDETTGISTTEIVETSEIDETTKEEPSTTTQFISTTRTQETSTNPQLTSSTTTKKPMTSTKLTPTTSPSSTGISTTLKVTTAATGKSSTAIKNPTTTSKEFTSSMTTPSKSSSTTTLNHRSTDLDKSTIFTSSSKKPTVNKIICSKDGEMAGNSFIHWTNEVTKGYWAAKPHCIDEGNMYVLCQEVGEELVRYKNCTRAQSPINYCPRNMKPIGKSFCREEIKEETFENSKCSYNNVLSISDDDQAKESYIGWYPAMRDTTYGIGPFFYNQFHEYGPLEDTTPYKYGGKYAESNCMIYEKGVIIAVSCNSTYKRSCTYLYLHKSQYTNCEPLFEALSCMSSSFDVTELKCFCITTNETCKAAELLNEYHNGIAFLLNKPIRIPIKSTNGLVSWSQSNIRLGYTNWSPQNTFVGQNFDKAVITSDGWLIQTNDVKFRVCEFQQDYEVPEITFVDHKKELELKIASSEYLLNISGQAKIFCFTDGFKDSLLRRVEITPDYKIKTVESGRYWCEWFDIKFIKATSKKVIREFHNIYVVEVSVAYEDTVDPTKSAYNYIYNIEKVFKEHSSYIGDVQIKWMKTLWIVQELGNHTACYTLHVCTKLDELNYLRNMQEIHKVLLKVKEQGVFVSMSEVFSNKFCARSETIVDDHIIVWEHTNLEKFAVASEMCLTSNGKVARRKCTGDYLGGAKWEPPDKCQIYNGIKSEHTDELYELLNTNASTKEVIENLSLMTNDVKSFEPIDVHLVASISENVDPAEVNVSGYVKIISDLMGAETNLLRSAQNDYNATDNLLATLDTVFLATNTTQPDELVEDTNLKALVFRSEDSNYTGLALVSNGSSLMVQKITRGMSEDDLANIDGMVVGTVIPKELLELLVANKSKIVISIFLNDRLFSDNITTCGKNIGVLLPNVSYTFNYTIPLFFRTSEFHDAKCGFWRYGNGQQGKWSPEGASKVLPLKMHLCEFPHVTHFGLLLATEELVDDTGFFSFLITVESVLSCVGLCGVITTASIFKNWRNEKANQLLIHYSVISLLQILLLYISDNVDLTGVACVSIGALLHFTVLSQFFWMLLMAISQYTRYINVLGNGRPWSTIKAVAICYLTPSCPVLVVVSLFPHNYVKGKIGLCYPKGNGLIFGVMVPVGCIVTANLVCFGVIFLELFCRRVNYNLPFEWKLKIRLTIMMFFVLGITWVFGLMAEVFRSPFLAYAFTITSSIQGFVLFIFSIVLNKNVRKMYWNKFK